MAKEARLVIVTIVKVNSFSKTLKSSDDWVDGASFSSPCFNGAEVGDVWVALVEPSISCFGRIEKAILVKRV